MLIMKKTLLDLSREVQAISQTGLAFSKDPYDLIRYKQLVDVAAELIAVNSGHTKEFLNNIFSGETGYATPKLGTRVAVFRGDKILMVKESASGAWTLPGGYVDVNESLSASAEKEVFEESGFIVKSQKVAAIFDCRKHEYEPHLYHIYTIFVICELTGGSAKTSIETTDVAFFSKAEIEELKLDSGRITKKHALRMFDHHAQPALPVDFD
jgi:ADP-ribose pyrophosphatase YjhB (NUDIX family)